MKKILLYISFLIVLSPLAIDLSNKETATYNLKTSGKKTIRIEMGGL